jgi:hypothetical protein
MSTQDSQHGKDHQQGPSIPADEIYREQVLAAGYDLLSSLHDITFHQGDGQDLAVEATQDGIAYMVENLRHIAERAQSIATTTLESLQQAEAVRTWIVSAGPRWCANCGELIDVEYGEVRICRGRAEHEWCHLPNTRFPNATEQDEDRDRAYVIEDAEQAAYCEDRERSGGPRHDDHVTVTFPDGRRVEGAWYVPGPAPLSAPIVVTFDVTEVSPAGVVVISQATEVSPTGAQVSVSGLGEDFIEYGPPSLEDLARGAELAAAFTGLTQAQPTSDTTQE